MACPSPADVLGIGIDYDRRHYRDDLYDTLGVACPDRIRRAPSPNRRADYLVGRYAAKLLLARVGSDDAIATGAHGAPLWPSGIVGSISHSGRYAIACIARTDTIALLGVDIEHCLSDAEAANCASTIVRDDEDVAALCRLPYGQAVTLAFSCKESLFKALYPRVGDYFDFHAARLVEVDADERRFTLSLAEDLPGGFANGRRFHGTFVVGPDAVTTLVHGSP